MRYSPAYPTCAERIKKSSKNVRKRKSRTCSSPKDFQCVSDGPGRSDAEIEELNRRISERLIAKSSIVGYASGISMNRALEPVSAWFKTAMVKQDPSAEQSKTSGQIDSEGFEFMWEKYTARIACLRDSAAETITPERLKVKLDALLILGHGLLMALLFRRNRGIENFPKKTIEDFSRIDVGKEYQFWYTEALAVIKRLLPSRVRDFVGLYEYQRKRSKLTNSNFRIADVLRGHPLEECIPLGFKKSDALHNIRVLGLSECFCLVKAQCDILGSANDSFTSSLHKIQQVAQLELLDAELKAARRLSENGSPRAAGAIAGLVLEKHLSAVIGSHDWNMSKKSPGINDYARKLKGKGVIGALTCRSIQSLGNLRDYCYVAKSEPKKEEVAELINGVDKIIKTVV